MKDDWCYFNGKIVRFNKIKISPYDLGFVRSFGIFDAMRTANGVPFCFDEHWEKFLSSANCLELEISVDKKEFEKIIQILKEKNNFKEMAIKTILTGGESVNGFTRAKKTTLIIITDDLRSFSQPKNIYIDGCKIVSCQFKRNLPEFKNLDYLKPLSIQSFRDKEGALEIVYKNEGNFLECSTSNIFMIKNGVVITPKKDIFLGNTRNLIIDLVKKNGFAVEERQIKEDEFFRADEVFLTATYKKVIPVVNIDNRLVGDGKVGNITKKIMIILDDFISNYSLG